MPVIPDSYVNNNDAAMKTSSGRIGSVAERLMPPTRVVMPPVSHSMIADSAARRATRPDTVRNTDPIMKAESGVSTGTGAYRLAQRSRVSMWGRPSGLPLSAGLKPCATSERGSTQVISGVT